MKKKTVLWILIIFFILAAILGFIAFFVFGLGEPSVRVPTRSYLDINLTGPVDETATDDFIYTALLNIKRLNIHSLWTNFRKAAVDSRINAVLLRIGPLGCDWAKANEIRDCIHEFRKSGKKVFAYVTETNGSSKEYFIAAACDQIFLHPLGMLAVNGIGGYVPFFKKTLDMLGIKAEFEQVEQYKTAYNIFTENGFTSAHKEETSSILSDINSQFISAVVSSRNLSEGQVKSLINRGFFQGEEAKKAGLVDECYYEDEVTLAIEDKGASLTKISLDDYSKISPASLGLENGPTIALIYANGTILPGESMPEVLGSTTLSRWLKKVRQDRSVKAVVLRVNSPGGSAVASDIIWREIELTRRVKPVIVSMSDLAGSGGYWISMPATKIVAQPQTLTGSIGVLAGKFSFAGLLDKLGVTTEKILFGERADVFSPFRPFTPEERKFLKNEILWIYEQFLKKAAQGRKISEEDVDRVGKGRVWTGRQAQEINLVDELGGLNVAVMLAKKEADIPLAVDVKLDVWPKRKSLWERIRSSPMFGFEGRTVSFLKMIITNMQLLSNVRVWAVMPLWLKES